jgi:hypothetical protein
MPSSCFIVGALPILFGAIGWLIFYLGCDDRIKPCNDKIDVLTNSTITKIEYTSYDCTYSNPICLEQSIYCFNRVNIGNCPVRLRRKRCIEYLRKNCYASNITFTYNIPSKDTILPTNSIPSNITNKTCNIVIYDLEKNSTIYDNITSQQIYVSYGCSLTKREYDGQNRSAMAGLILMILWPCIYAILFILVCILSICVSTTKITNIQNPMGLNRSQRSFYV